MTPPPTPSTLPSLSKARKRKCRKTPMTPIPEHDSPISPLLHRLAPIITKSGDLQDAPVSVNYSDANGGNFSVGHGSTHESNPIRQKFEGYEQQKKHDGKPLACSTPSDEDAQKAHEFPPLYQRKRLMLSVLWLLIVLIILCTIAYTLPASYKFWRSQTHLYSTSNQSYKFENAAVATDSPECSEVGARILQKGGNAVDAAIAAGLCLGVRRPFASGIGGGGYMLVHMKDGKNVRRLRTEESNDTPLTGPQTYSVDFREYAGKLAHRDMYEESPSTRHYNPKKHPFHYGHFDRSTYGASSIAIPGEIKGFAVAHKKFGRLPWKDLFEDAIRYAEEGFHVEPLLALRCKQRATDILKSESLTSFLTREEDAGIFSRLILRKSAKRRLLREGDFVRQPALARTLRRIAEQGWEAFYEGDMMSTMLKAIQTQDSYLTEEDFKDYRVRVRKAHRVGFQGADDKAQRSDENAPPRYSILTTHAPSSGAITAFALSILDELHRKDQQEQHDATHQRRTILSSHQTKHHTPFLNRNARFWHHVIESLKHAFSHRTFLGDPHHVPGVRELLKSISNSEYINRIVSRVNSQRTYTDWAHYAVNETLIEPHDSGTSALSIVDEEGNAVSMATTVNHSFGSLVYLNELGFIMNNHMSDFSVSRSKSNVFGFLPSAHNCIAPKKRPTSSMSPIIIVDHGETRDGQSQKVVLAASASGGSTIISALVQTLAMHLFHDIAPHEIIPQPRLHILPGMTEVRVEPGFSNMYLRALEKEFGHRFRYQGILADGHSIGNVQIVVREKETGMLEAFSDERKLGKPSGY